MCRHVRTGAPGVPSEKLHRSDSFGSGSISQRTRCKTRPARILTRQQMDLLKQIESASDKVISPLQDLEDSLHTMVNNFIVPLFAFANAGIVFSGMHVSDLWTGVSLAVIAGLVVGKFIGIFLFSWISVKLRIAPMPHSANWNMMAAVAVLGGIGFTVSLFIANL